MSWSVPVNNIQEVEALPLDVQELFASQHPAYPRDAHTALAFAKLIGLSSATLCGCRTPNPYGGDEVVDISIRGVQSSKDFMSEMRRIIATGPSADSDIARHYAALARLHESPCSHVLTVVDMPTNSNQDQWIRQCVVCGVNIRGMMLWFDEDMP